MCFLFFVLVWFLEYGVCSGFYGGSESGGYVGKWVNWGVGYGVGVLGSEGYVNVVDILGLFELKGGNLGVVVFVIGLGLVGGFL